MPQAVREEIQRIADISEMTISVTQDALVFAVRILVLLVKPTGLLGKPVREKV